MTTLSPKLSAIRELKMDTKWPLGMPLLESKNVSLIIIAEFSPL